jgi:RNA polymerase-interacting CarD/CdnL/TRCF family regulator
VFFFFQQTDNFIKEIAMEFHNGDPVMHWTYGLGTIIRLEERNLSGSNMLYYAVQIGDMIVWVPADDHLKSRLRSPTLMAKFTRLLTILSDPSEMLPTDRQERRLLLLDWLKNGSAEALCRVVRDLSAFRSVHPFNETDQALLKRSQHALLGEWGFVFSLTSAEAEIELNRLLAHVV